MAQYKQATQRKMSATEVALRLYAAQSPEVQASLDWLRKRYGKYAMPAAELRKMMDKQLGDPDIASSIASLKRKFKKYAMSLDEARKVIDASMGSKTLTELLYEARE